MAAPPTPPTTAPTGPPTTAPPTAPATPPVTAPLSVAIAAEEEAEINAAAAAARIHRDIKTSYVYCGSPRLTSAFRFDTCQRIGGGNVPGVVQMVRDV